MPSLYFKRFFQLMLATVTLISASHGFATYPNSFYIGGLGGLNMMSREIDTTTHLDFMISGTPIVSATVTPNPRVYKRSGIVSFLAGYQLGIFDRFLLGLEGRANIVNQSKSMYNSVHELISNFQITTQNDLTQLNSYDLLIKPGIFLTEHNHIFLVFGATRADLKLSTFTTFGLSPAPGLDLSASNELFARKRKWGSILGIGADQNLTKHLSARLEYDYINLGRITALDQAAPLVNATPGIDLSGSALTTTGATRLKNNRVELGLVLSFG